MKKRIFTLLLVVTFQLVFSQSVNDTLIVGYSSAPPFIVEKGEEPEGINIWLWQQLAKDLNIQYRLVAMDFSEMLEALQNGRIDVCINPLTITSDRSKKMEFSHSFYASNSTIAVTEASSIQKFIKYIKPFFNVNFIKGVVALLVIVFLFGTIAWHFERRKNHEQFRPGWKGIFDGIWWSVVTMTTVGYGDKSPKSRGGKMIALIWMFSGLLFVSGLTASIASSLTVDRMSNSVKNFNEFKERYVGSIKKSSSSEFLKSNFFSDLKLYTNVTDGLTDLNNGKIDAFIYDEPILKFRIKQNNKFNNLQVLPIKFDLQFYAFGLPKDRIELEQQISQKILEITESHEWKVVLSEYNLSQI